MHIHVYEYICFLMPSRDFWLYMRAETLIFGKKNEPELI